MCIPHCTHCTHCTTNPGSNMLCSEKARMVMSRSEKATVHFAHKKVKELKLGEICHAIIDVVENEPTSIDDISECFRNTMYIQTEVHNASLTMVRHNIFKNESPLVLVPYIRFKEGDLVWRRVYYDHCLCRVVKSNEICQVTHNERFPDDVNQYALERATPQDAKVATLSHVARKQYFRARSNMGLAMGIIHPSLLGMGLIHGFLGTPYHHVINDQHTTFGKCMVQIHDHHDHHFKLRHVKKPNHYMTHKESVVIVPSVVHMVTVPGTTLGFGKTIEGNVLRIEPMYFRPASDMQRKLYKYLANLYPTKTDPKMRHHVAYVWEPGMDNVVIQTRITKVFRVYYSLGAIGDTMEWLKKLDRPVSTKTTQAYDQIQKDYRKWCCANGHKINKTKDLVPDTVPDLATNPSCGGGGGKGSKYDFKVGDYVTNKSKEYVYRYGLDKDGRTTLTHAINTRYVPLSWGVYDPVYEPASKAQIRLFAHHQIEDYVCHLDNQIAFWWKPHMKANDIISKCNDIISLKGIQTRIDTLKTLGVLDNEEPKPTKVHDTTAFQDGDYVDSNNNHHAVYRYIVSCGTPMLQSVEGGVVKVMSASMSAFTLATDAQIRLFKYTQANVVGGTTLDSEIVFYWKEGMNAQDIYEQYNKLIPVEGIQKRMKMLQDHGILHIHPTLPTSKTKTKEKEPIKVPTPIKRKANFEQAEDLEFTPEYMVQKITRREQSVLDSKVQSMYDALKSEKGWVVTDDTLCKTLTFRNLDEDMGHHRACMVKWQEKLEPKLLALGWDTKIEVGQYTMTVTLSTPRS